MTAYLSLPIVIAMKEVHKTSPVSPKKRYMMLKQYLTLEDQQAICQEALACHNQHRGPYDKEIQTAKVLLEEASLKLALNLECGGDIGPRLPMAVSKLKPAFDCANRAFSSSNNGNPSEPSVLDHLSQASTSLTGLALLYGPNAYMKPHYDSPTQPGRQSEWLVCASLGATAIFRCNDEQLVLESGDALVLDSMAVLHGIEGIVRDDNVASAIGLPPHSRLGILMWQAKTPVTMPFIFDDTNLDGVDSLFSDGDNDDHD